MSDEHKVIYINSEDNRYRFALGIDGKNPLICIGVNPSTATPEEYDRTMYKLKKVAEDPSNDYDGHIMVNLYPKRCVDPTTLPYVKNFHDYKENLEVIEEILKGGNLTVWLAWGTSIDYRDYLKESALEIIDLARKYNNKLICRGTTKDGHPRHPCRQANNIPFEDVDYWKIKILYMG